MTGNHFMKHLRAVSLAAILALVVAAGMTGLAAAQEPVDGSDEEGTAEVDSCAQCHVDVEDHWQSSLHASQDVTCEDCHGEVPQNHPSTPVDLEIAVESCAECHTVTSEEFDISEHAEIGLECTNCHEPHSNELIRDSVTEQCLSCHGAGLEGVLAHEVHIDNDVTCMDCHGYVRIEDMEALAEGQHPTGHTFEAPITACVDCHEGNVEVAALPEGVEEASSGDAMTGQQAQLRAAQLEAALQTQLLAQRNATVMNIVLGSVGGLLIGGLVVFFLSRRQDSGELAEADEHDNELDE